MEEITINIHIEKKQAAELTPMERTLIDRACQATYTSYAPYSRFSVGAALLLDDGTIVPGCNQENSSTPCGICAERSAVFAAGALYPERHAVAICVAARDVSGAFTTRPISPCGACRQVLCETEDRGGHPIRIMLYGSDGIYMLSSARDLLPFSFDGSYLQ